MSETRIRILTPEQAAAKFTTPQQVAEEAKKVVPAEVDKSLSSNSTVIEAAATAASNEIATRGLLEGKKILEDTYIFAIVDEDGRRTWLEVAADGGLTDRAAAKIAAAVKDQVNAYSGLASQNHLASNIAFVVTDEDGLRTELEVGLDGKFTQRVVDSLSARMNVTLEIPAKSTKDLLLIGHSMLAGASGAIGSVATNTGRTSVSIAVGGETMQTISGRWGSHATRILPTGGVIPASGSVVVTVNSDAQTPFGQGPQSYETTLVYPDGSTIPGTFAKVGSDFTFTRTTAGSEIPTTRPTVLKYTISETNRTRTVVYWAARNGSWTGTNAVRERLDRMEGMIQHQYALDKRFLVLSEHKSINDATDVRAAIDDYNRQALLRWGSRFIDTQKYLIDYGLADRNITPTSQDTSNIASGLVPASFVPDGLHLTSDGSAVVADLIKNRLLELGW